MSEQINVPYIFDIQQKFEDDNPLRSPGIFNMWSNYTRQDQKELDFASENSAKFSFQKLRQSELSREQLASIQNNLKFTQFYKNKISERKQTDLQSRKEQAEQFQLKLRHKKLRKRSQEVSPQTGQGRTQRKHPLSKFFCKDRQPTQRSDRRMDILNVELEEMIKYDKINLNSCEREDSHRVFQDNIFLHSNRAEEPFREAQTFEVDANNNKVFTRKQLRSNKSRFEQVFSQMGEPNKSPFNLPSTKLRQSKKIKKTGPSVRCQTDNPTGSQNSFFAQLIEVNLNLASFLLKVFEQQPVQSISSRSILKFLKDKSDSQRVVKNPHLYSNFANSRLAFSLSDLQFIYLFFKTSQNLYENYKDCNQYYIKQGTNEVFLQLPANSFQRSQRSIQPETLQLLDQADIEGQFDCFNMQVPQLLEPEKSACVSPSGKVEEPQSVPPSFPKKEEGKVTEEESLGKCPNTSTTELFTPRKVKKRKADRKKQKGCKCSKSKCLRLHCICFRDKLLCGPACGCKGCLNTEQHSHLVDRVYNVTKDINSQAFESRFVSVLIDGQVKKFTKGCTCSKNNCLKNYCECHKNGMPCTPLCKCEHCKNEKVHIEPGVANQLLQRSSRKKKKFLIKNKNLSNIEIVEQVLMNNTRNS
jgi:hypothetical protein